MHRSIPKNQVKEGGSYILSSDQNAIGAGRRRRGRAGAASSANDMDGFGEFPPEISAATPEISTPQITNKRAHPQSRIRFAEDTRLSPMRTNRVLVLGGSGDRLVSNAEAAPSSSATPEATSLDFSMITTPGGKQARMVGNNGVITPSEVATPAGISRRWTPGTPFSNILRGVVSSTPSTPFTPYTAARESLNKQQITGDDGDSSNNNECTAIMFARTAPLHGYLRKLGKNVPTFKRRFFVLKPSTHLYYFMSPNDVEPRGCIDLDMVLDDGDGIGARGCEVREIGVLPDGTFRFELLFDKDTEEDDGNSAMDDNASSDTASRASRTSSQSSKRRNFQRQSIVLEARTEEIGREWMAKLQSERLSTTRDEVDYLSSNLAEMKSISARWENSACEEAMRADDAERQRNTAISEAKSWEGKFTDLNEAIRLLVRYNKQEGGSPSEFLAEALEGLDVSETNFSDVSEAFQKIHNDYNLISKREEEANELIAKLEQRAKDAESRAAKAEEELSQLWEDNHVMQNDLKKTKREKRILVKEVKSLHAAAEEDTSKQSSAQHQYIDQKCDLRSTNSQSNSRGGASTADTMSLPQPRRKMNEEEKRLVIELEEHVMSGLRLSEQFLTLSGIDPSEVGDDFLDDSVQASIYQTKPSLDKSPERPSNHHLPQKPLLDLSPIPSAKTANETLQQYANKPLGSLLDENDDESEVGLVATGAQSIISYHENEEVDHISDVGCADVSCAAESTQGSDLLNDIYQYEEASSGDPVNQNLNDRFKEQMPFDTPIQQESTNNSNTQVTLNVEEDSTGWATSLDVASSVSESSRSKVTDNGHATTKLECPLKDVGETPHHSRPSHSSLGDDGRVYHITFYSSKIGLQFQKVPNMTKSPGLLTDAMTADHGPNVEMNQTAAEIRRIASISQHSRTRNRKDALSTECLPATPADAVLVCGFVGFDDSTGNIRPRIGARLVAFDGIPVEVGQWTFESIRKSIQARGRPLTLSFRNDFLNSKQREILTKAIEDVNPQPQSAANSHGSRRDAPSRERHDDCRGHKNTIYSSTSSISSQPSQTKKKYYSFSETGSTISSAVAPLMSNLLSNHRSDSGKDHNDFAPDYLKRTPDSLDKMRHHHDFQSGLL